VYDAWSTRTAEEEKRDGDGKNLKKDAGGDVENDNIYIYKER